MKTIKIKTSVLGEIYYFYITVHPNTLESVYSIHTKNNPKLKCKITEQLTHIILEEPILLQGYKNGLNPPQKKISKIKIPKDVKISIREEIYDQ